MNAREDRGDAGKDGPGLWQRLTAKSRLWSGRFLPGGVSRIHLYEASERFYGLKRDVEYQLALTRHIPNEKPRVDNDALEKRGHTLELCKQILDSSEHHLTRRQEDLNQIWRALTRVHIMLLEHVYDDSQLVNQLTFFREEAYRLNLQNDSSVTNLLQAIAEVMKEHDDEDGQDRPRLVRALRAALERFTSIRTERMHQQFVNLRTYKFALIILIPISLIMIANADLLTADSPEGAEQDAGDNVAAVEPAPDAAEAPTLLSMGGISARIRGSLEGNVLGFVYFAGLAGGFFSAAIRGRSQGVEPGEDAYFTWYVLTKPLVGALGAMILFILLGGGFISFEALPNMDGGWEPGPTLFGFGFLAGFSERLVFPELK